MKAWMQKLISVLMCLTLVLSLGATAFAGNTGAGEDSGMSSDQLAVLQELERLRQEEELRKQQEELARKQMEAAPLDEAAKNNPAPVEPAADSISEQGDDIRQFSGISADDSSSAGQFSEQRKAAAADDKSIGLNGEAEKQNEESAEGEEEEPAEEGSPVGDGAPVEDDESAEGADYVENAEPVDAISGENNTEQSESLTEEADEQDQDDSENEEPEEESFQVQALSLAPKSMFLKDLKSGDTATILAAGSSGAKGGSSPTEYIDTGKTEITMDGEELDGTNDDQGSDWNWNSVEGTLSILSHEIKELVVKEGDLTIQAAGFNRINSLVSNSVVNIIGTGILLLDDYDLKDSGVVKLTENTMYEDTGVVGSVAVFLKDKEAKEENTYKLINGSIPALLDAAGNDPDNEFGYEIPSGYHLILPCGTSLIMNSFVTPPMVGSQYEYYSGLDFDPSDPSVPDFPPEKFLENAASLKISSGASLTVEKGASIEMISTNSKVHNGEALSILTPKIEVADGGKLGIEGLFKGYGQITGKDSDISGLDPSSETVINIVGAKIVGMITTLEAEPFEKHAGDPISFDELKAAWLSMYPGYPVDTIEAFVIIVNGKSVEIREGDEDKVKFPSYEDEWGSLSKNPVTGIGIAAAAIAATGNGIIENKWEFPSGGSKVILTAAKENLWRVIVTENPKRGTWTLSVWYGDTQIFDLGVTTVRARFQFDRPDDWDTKNIYVVFLDKDGKSLKAFPATYDTVTGELVFDSSLVGEFVVVQFDYQGELYSKGFYEELAKLDAVKHLVDLHNGKAN